MAFLPDGNAQPDFFSVTRYHSLEENQRVPFPSTDPPTADSKNTFPSYVAGTDALSFPFLQFGLPSMFAQDTGG